MLGAGAESEGLASSLSQVGASQGLGDECCVVWGVNSIPGPGRLCKQQSRGWGCGWVQGAPGSGPRAGGGLFLERGRWGEAAGVPLAGSVYTYGPTGAPQHLWGETGSFEGLDKLHHSPS